MSDQPVSNYAHGLHPRDERAVAGHHGHGAEPGALEVLVVLADGLAGQQAALSVEAAQVWPLLLEGLSIISCLLV